MPDELNKFFQMFLGSQLQRRSPSKKVVALGFATLLAVVLLEIQNFTSLNDRYYSPSAMRTTTRFVTGGGAGRRNKRSLFEEHMRMAMSHDYSFDGTRFGFEESGVVSTGDHAHDAPPRFVLGIFSVDSEKAAARRRLIRDTYLTANRPDGLRDPRVCSLLEHLDGPTTEEKERCAVLYVFVVGAHDSTNVDVDTDHYRTDRDVVVPRHKLPSTLSSGILNERDVVFLNVRENMNAGKTPTYFKWASTALPPDTNHYIAKVDDDTMVYVPALFRHVVYKVTPPPYNVRVYGGKKSDWFQCGQHKHCESVIPHGYMTGSFFFLSADLARDVTADEQERDYDVVNQKGKHFEDMDMGRWIFDNVRRTWRCVTMVTPGLNVFHWLHPVKTEEEWTELWNGYERDSVPYICAEGHGDPKNPC